MLQEVYVICTLAYRSPTLLQHISIEGSTPEHKLRVGLKNAISLLAHLFNEINNFYIFGSLFF